MFVFAVRWLKVYYLLLKKSYLRIGNGLRHVTHDAILFQNLMELKYCSMFPVPGHIPLRIGRLSAQKPIPHCLRKHKAVQFEVE